MSTATDDITKEQTNEQVQQPKQYMVMLHNCDFVAFPAVMESLMSAFAVDENKAAETAKAAHDSGEVVVITSTRDIAETKAEMAQRVVEQWHQDMGVEEPSSIYSVAESD